MGMSPISADEARRLREEVERGPLFSKYPPVVDIGFAFTVALEHIEEWSHADDPDGWCHQRPILLTLAAEVERLSADNARLREALRRIAEYGGGDGGDWVECCEIARAALADEGDKT